MADEDVIDEEQPEEELTLETVLSEADKEPELVAAPVEAAEELPAVEEQPEEDVSQETFQREPAQDYNYQDLDTAYGHQATKRVYLIQGILADVRRDEPDIPPALLSQFEAELVDGVDGQEGRRPFTIAELEHMRTSRSVVHQASGIVRQMQLQGKLKKESKPVQQEKAPKNRTDSEAPKKTLSEAGRRLADRLAASTGVSREAFDK